MRSSASFSLNDGLHNHRLAINQLLNFFDRSSLPGVLNCIVPHQYCPFLLSILLQSLQIKLGIFISIRKFGLFWLSIVRPWGKTGIVFVLKCPFRIRNFNYPNIFPRPPVNLNSISLHELCDHLAVELCIIIHNQKFELVLFAPREDSFLEIFLHKFTIDVWMFKVIFFHRYRMNQIK